MKTNASDKPATRIGLRVQRLVRQDRSVVDFHQLDPCDCGEAQLDHWKTKNDDGTGTFWATWECPACGYFDGQTEDAAGHRV